MDHLPSYRIDVSNLPPASNYPRAGKFMFNGQSYSFHKQTTLKKKLLGEGETGFVFQCEFIPLKMDFALKTIRISSLSEIQNVLSEAHNLQGMSHPNIISCYGYYLSNDHKQLKIALEFMDCGTLSNLMSLRSTIPENYASYIARQILQSLDYIHKNKYYHRDIKPSNILLNKSGQVKLGDFGTSKQVKYTNESVNSGVGTFRYFSLERLLAKSYTHSADIWAFGLTLLECVLGKFPIDFIKNICFMEFIKKVENFDIKVYMSQISPELFNFLKMCLTRNPSQRASAELLLQTPFITKHFQIDSQAFGQWMCS